MSNNHVKDCLVAIKAVRAKAKESISTGRYIETATLMADLSALELCLEIETQKLVDEMDKEVA